MGIGSVPSRSTAHTSRGSDLDIWNPEQGRGLLDIDLQDLKNARATSEDQMKNRIKNEIRPQSGIFLDTGA